MRTNVKKTGALLLAAMTTFGLVSCGGGNEGEPSKGEANTLYVGAFDSGVDASWLDKLEKKYEALHPEIDIQIDKKKSEFEMQNLQNTIETNRQDLYFVHRKDKGYP